MKKLIFLTATITSMLCSSAFADSVAPISVLVNDNAVTFDQPPMIEEGRTLVPLRAIFEALDAKVIWDEATQSISAERNSKNIKLTIDSTEATINGESYTLDVPAKIENSRTLVPVRFIAESMNCDVSWDDSTKTVKIQCDTTKFSMPNEICVADGKTITIYNKYIMDTITDKYTFTWSCEIGEATQDGFSITGATDKLGEYPLMVEVKDENGKTLYSAQTTVKVVKNTVNEISILPIGDSLTNNKSWLSEVRALSNDMVTFVGTRGKAPLNQEGRSGFSSTGYMTGSEYKFENEGLPPFWDGERFNWNYYKEQTGISPDAVQIFLGTNGLKKSPNGNADNIKALAKLIRQDDSEIPIFIVNTMYRGIVYNNVETLEINEPTTSEQHKMIFDLTEYLTSILGDMENVHIIPAAYLFDSKKNHTPEDAVHPEYYNGYAQLSDVIYSTYCAYLD